MKKRKWLWAIPLILLLAIAGLWIWWKQPNSSIKAKAKKFQPEVNVASINVTDIDEDKISATASLSIRNNLPVEINAGNLRYTVFIDSSKILEDTYPKPVVLRSNDTALLNFPIELHFKKLGNVLKRLENRKEDSALYTVKSSFVVDVPIAGEKNFNVDFSKKLPAIRIPEAKVKSVDIGKLSFKKSSVDVVMSIQNKNPFPLKMKNGKYKFSIDDDKNMLEGELQKVVNIPAKSTTPVEMHVDMKTMKLPKLGWKMLFDKKDTRFNMVFNCKIESENDIFDDSKMNFKMKGTLKELADAMQ